MSTLHPHDQAIADARETIASATPDDLRRAQLAYQTFNVDNEHDLLHWADTRPTYVARWIAVGQVLRDDQEGKVAV